MAMGDGLEPRERVGPVVSKLYDVTLAVALFNINLSAHRFQDAKTLALYRVSDKKCDPKTGEISLDIMIERDHPFAPPLNPPRRETVYFRDHYLDRAEEVPLMKREISLRPAL